MTSEFNWHFNLLGPFEKFTQVKMIKPLTGKMYSEKVSENCVAYWKAVGTYTDAEEKAIEKFNDAFKDEMFPPGSSILFNQSPLGILTVSIIFRSILFYPCFKYI